MDDTETQHQPEHVAEGSNRFATARSVSDVIEQLAASAASGQCTADAEQHTRRIVAEAKERLVELGVADFG